MTGRSDGLPALVEQWRSEVQAHRDLLAEHEDIDAAGRSYHEAAIEYKLRCAHELEALAAAALAPDETARQEPYAGALETIRGLHAEMADYLQQRDDTRSELAALRARLHALAETWEAPLKSPTQAWGGGPYADGRQDSYEVCAEELRAALPPSAQASGNVYTLDDAPDWQALRESLQPGDVVIWRGLRFEVRV